MSASSIPRRRTTVAIAFVRGMVAGMVHRGDDIGPLLLAEHIEPGCLADDGTRVPIERYAALYNRIVETMDDEGFGLFSSPLRLGTLEFLCRAAITAPDLGSALERITRFLRLVLPDLAVELKREGGSACLEITECRHLVIERRFALEWLLRLLHGMACWLAGRGIALDTVDFPYPRPAHADDYAMIYTERSHFDCPVMCARFSANLLELPIRRDETALLKFLDGAPGKLTLLYRRDRELVLRVRDILRQTLPDWPDQNVVAARLGLAPRTLHRRLADEGSSFRAIKDALRRDLALSRLTKTSLPVARIAADLGFADPSAFYRACMVWTGLPPSGYRRMKLRGQ